MTLYYLFQVSLAMRLCMLCGRWCKFWGRYEN